MAGIGAKVRDWFNGGDPQGHIKIRQWLRGYDDRPEGSGNSANSGNSAQQEK